MENMYFLIVIKGIPESGIENYRVFGASYDKDYLAEAAINNYGDIYEEGYYDYCLITKISQLGLYPNEEPEQWYAWNCEDEEQLPAKPINCPEGWEDNQTFIIG